MSLIGRFEYLPNRPRSDEAKPLLEKIASQVKPIMAKRDWKVGTLAEFLPLDPSLLGNNMNAGQKINLRLRPPGDVTTFYEFDQLVLVMLHELVHIVHGPHDTSFYKLLSEVEEEFYDLKRKGYSGEGFHSEGSRLQGLRVNEYEGKRRGLLAAEKRASQQRLIGRGGVLGGASSGGKTMREAVAEATQRRIRDDLACNTQDRGHAKEVEAEVRRAAEESVGVDASSPQSPPQPQPDSASSSKTPSAATILSNARPVTTTKPTPYAKPQIKPKRPTDAPPVPATKSKPVAPVAELSSGEWSCPTCTLLNPQLSLTCEACATARPGRTVTADGWFCEFCGAGPRGMGFWSCEECGWVRKWG